MKAEAVICGAGIAGIAAAYHLSVQRGVRDVVIVDELPPLSLTSDKSTECYRNWWPGPGDAMVALSNRSIDILEGLAEEVAGEADAEPDDAGDDDVGSDDPLTQEPVPVPVGASDPSGNGSRAVGDEATGDADSTDRPRDPETADETADDAADPVRTA